MAYNSNKTKLSLVGATSTTKLAIGFSNDNDNVCCFACDAEFQGLMTWQIDHVIPQSYFKNRNLKVDNSVLNLCILCPSCNQKKRDKDAREFFGEENLARLAECQQKAQNATIEQIEAYARRFANESYKFCRLYKGGKFLRTFWKNGNVVEQELDEYGEVLA